MQAEFNLQLKFREVQLKQITETISIQLPQKTGHGQKIACTTLHKLN